MLSAVNRRAFNVQGNRFRLIYVRNAGGAALAAGVCSRTVRKWLTRFQAEDLAGLQDCSPGPHRLQRRYEREGPGELILTAQFFGMAARRLRMANGPQATAKPRRRRERLV